MTEKAGLPARFETVEEAGEREETEGTLAYRRRSLSYGDLRATLQCALHTDAVMAGDKSAPSGLSETAAVDTLIEAVEEMFDVWFNGRGVEDTFGPTADAGDVEVGELRERYWDGGLDVLELETREERELVVERFLTVLGAYLDELEGKDARVQRQIAKGDIKAELGEKLKSWEMEREAVEGIVEEVLEELA